MRCTYIRYKSFKFTDLESRMVVARAEGEGREMGSCLMCTEFQFCWMKSPGDLLHSNARVLDTIEVHT